MGTYLWVKTEKRQELLDIVGTIPEFSRKKISEILEMALEEFVKKHGKSNNPQSQITQYHKGGILQVPDIYESIDNPHLWKKFYSMIKTDKEFKLVDQSLNEILRLHNKRDKEMRHAIH